MWFLVYTCQVISCADSRHTPRHGPTWATMSRSKYLPHASPDKRPRLQARYMPTDQHLPSTAPTTVSRYSAFSRRAKNVWMRHHGFAECADCPKSSADNPVTPQQSLRLRITASEPAIQFVRFICRTLFKYLATK